MDKSLIVILLFICQTVLGQQTNNIQNAKIQNAKLGQVVASAPPAPIFSMVQSNHVYVASSASFLSNVTAGNCIVVSATSSGSAATACSDNLGNTYTLIETVSSGLSSEAVFVSFITTGGACTVTYTGASSDFGITIVEYHGPTAVDAHGNASGTNPSVSLTTTGNDMFFGAWGNESANNFTSAALNPGSFSPALINHDMSHWDAAVQWLNNGAGFGAGSYTVDLTGSGVWIGIAFK